MKRPPEPIAALAQPGTEAKAEAPNSIRIYCRFTAENDPQRKNEAVMDLIRAIFGKGASAEDSSNRHIVAQASMEASEIPI